jgi:hypothetical protein
VTAEHSAFTIAERLLLPALLARLTGTPLASAVYRDKRGTGKSFDRKISDPP